MTLIPSGLKIINLMVPLSLLDFEQYNSLEVILGLSAVGGLLVAVIIGFFYKRAQSKRNK